MTYLISQSKRPIKWLGFGFLGLSLLAFIGYWHDYWQHYPARSAADWQYGYEQAAKILGQNSLVTKQIFVENLDRIYLYFLFYNRIKPSEIQWKTKDYQIQAFNNYHFINANENTYRQLNPGDLLMIGNKSILPGVNFKLIQTIYNMQGDPLYLIYAKET